MTGCVFGYVRTRLSMTLRGAFLKDGHLQFTVEGTGPAKPVEIRH